MRFLQMIILVTAVCINTSVNADVPDLINFQGRLTDAEANPKSGTVNLSFEIFDSSDSGTLLWGPQEFSNVALVNGYFNVILGTDSDNRSIAIAFSSESAYLQFSQDGTAISPRQRILSAPFAIEASNTQTVKDIDVVAELEEQSERISNVATQLVVIKQQTSDIDGQGGSCVKNEYATRNLNLCEGVGVIDDSSCAGSGFVSLENSQVTLTSGSYLIEGFSIAYYVDHNGARLRNITNDETAIAGSSEFSPKGANGSSTVGSKVIGIVSLEETTTFELQHICDETQSNGLGPSLSIDAPAVHAALKIRKLN